MKIDKEPNRIGQIIGLSIGLFLFVISQALTEKAQQWIGAALAVFVVVLIASTRWFCNFQKPKKPDE